MWVFRNWSQAALVRTGSLEYKVVNHRVHTLFYLSILCMMLAKKDKVVIVGAGVFGLTTALELHSKGYTDITVLDRTLPPVRDSSSRLLSVSDIL